ncbi:hypothetical protein BJ741DRAFT_610520 [Chytriomyces cf. hyalinus JEL632]|nr:hypothetical protein BJ741DRAFT_610520 [Chytriomyces cf. hyalinus JEL632]
MIPQREGRRILMASRTSSGASNAVIDLTQTSPHPASAHPSNEDEVEQQEEHEDDYDEQQEFIHEHRNGSDNDSDADVNNRHVYHDMNPFLPSSDSEDRHLDSGEDMHSDSDARGSSDARESDGDGSSDDVEVISSNVRPNRTRSRLSSDSVEFISHTRALRSRHRHVYSDAASGRAREQLVLQRLRQRHLQQPSLGSDQDDEDPDAALARRLQEEEYSGVQSSNVEDNVQRLLGILESENADEEDEEDDDDEGGEETELDQDSIPRANNALNDALNDYRAIHRTRHSLLLDASGSSSSRTSTRQTAVRRRGRSSRATGANDDEHDALHAILVGMEWGGGTRGRRGRGRGRGSGAQGIFGASHLGVLGGLIPELYGAGVAYNPANYVADDHFDDSYEVTNATTLCDLCLLAWGSFVSHS